ncbi:hypothetical protein [Neobacillus sp.]|uniref:hypothetical protein n=1 Tax=Neobacillus sp. TaxID=2675273 RepID=UPI00289E0EDE|nr:hypothetical protein [Neobacillus sp.]
MTYEIYAVIILIVGILIATLSSLRKPKAKKFRIWGITTMLIIAPIASWLISSIYGLSKGSGFAMIGLLIILCPILFIAGIVLYWIGGRV